MKKYTGNCHCKAVTFEVESEITSAASCNCSHCFAKGFILAFVPKNEVTILTGEDNLSEYRFNKKYIAHQFCKTCGVQPFGTAVGPDGIETAAINLRCLNNLDISSLQTQEFDGKSI